MITIGFHYVDTFGNTYDSTSTVEVFYDQGDSELSVIGSKLDAFLSQVSYVRNGGTVYMGSITEEESEEIDAFLSTYREASIENKYMYMEALTPEEFDAVDGFLYSYRKKDKKLNESAVESDQLDGQISLF